jgi:hypothetical protein
MTGTKLVVGFEAAKTLKKPADRGPFQPLAKFPPTATIPDRFHDDRAIPVRLRSHEQIGEISFLYIDRAAIDHEWITAAESQAAF